MSEAGHFSPVDGDIIPVSRKKGLGNVLFGLVAVLLGSGVLFLKWYWIGGGAIFVGLVFIAVLGLPMAFSSERLVIGSECFQEVEGEGVVTDHVPFSNIAAVRYVEHFPPFIGVNLVDLADPNSYSKVRFASQKDHHGFDHVLVDVYTVEPRQVFDRLMAKYRAFLERGEPGEPRPA